MRYRYFILILVLIAAALPAVPAAAQGQRGAAQTPQAAAPIDLTGYWVSIVNEDWRFRMVMPPPGDYNGVPMTAAAYKVADAWDPAKDEAAGELCKAFGAPAILRVPEHLHITWQDASTLKLETDAGQQTRLFHFGEWKAPGGAPTLQGDSTAVWEGRNGKGSLKVSTSHMKAGYLRKNGVPYSENASLTEYYDIVKERNGDTILVVTIATTDPLYLREPFIITSHFKKQANADGWKPSPCTTRW